MKKPYGFQHPTCANFKKSLFITCRFLKISVVTNLVNSLALFPAITKCQWELFDAREAKPVDDERSLTRFFLPLSLNFLKAWRLTYCFGVIDKSTI